MRTKLLVVIMLLSLAVPAWSSGWSLYVKNKPLPDKIWVANKNFYAPLNVLLQSMGFSGTLDNGVIDIVSGGAASSSITTADPLQKFSFDGEVFFVPTLFANGKIYVEITSMAKALGYGVIYNADTKIIDVYLARPVSPASAATSSGGDVITASTSGAAATETSQGDQALQSGGPTGSKVFPFKVTKFEFYQNLANPNDVSQSSDVYGSINLKNISKEKISNIRVIAHFKPADSTNDNDEDISEAASDQNPFAQGAGEETSMNFYWRNISNLYYTVRVEIKYEGMPQNGWPFIKEAN
jgi:hypothetical protein